MYSNCVILVADCNESLVLIVLWRAKRIKECNEGGLMKKLCIKPGCTSCGACEFNAPNVFEVTDVSHVKQTADLEKNKEHIKKAIEGCPMGVIEWCEDDKKS